jgi:hypothetical protein
LCKKCKQIIPSISKVSKVWLPNKMRRRKKARHSIQYDYSHTICLRFRGCVLPKIVVFLSNIKGFIRTLSLFISLYLPCIRQKLCDPTTPRLDSTPQCQSQCSRLTVDIQVITFQIQLHLYCFIFSSVNYSRLFW